jgi:hypothetical protein
VIVVSGSEALKQQGPVIVVACSTTIRESESDRIRLPTMADTPTCRTGLPRLCWAVPRWFLVVERDRLTDYKGYISGDTLKRVLATYTARAKPRES